MTHPSALKLDRYALGEDLNEVRTHLGTCEHCREYIDAVSTPPATVPSWVRGRRRWRPWVGGMLLAATALIAIGFWFSPAVEPPAVQVRGGPSVRVFVRHQGAVTEWAGEAIQPGDSLRLGVVPSGYDRVIVHTGTDEEPGGLLLYDGPLGDSPLELVPASWTVDDRGTQEVLHVRLEGGGDPWSTLLVLEKLGDDP